MLDSGPLNPAEQQNQSNYADPGKDRARNSKYHDDENKDPVHTVFFFNIIFGINYNEFKSFVEKFGEVSNIYEKSEKGFYFVTYYDVRSAQRAIEEAPGHLLHGRPVKANYAYKADNPRREPVCATISVKLGDAIKINNVFDSEINDAFQKFGEIRSIKRENDNNTFVVKFYDLRHAKAANESTEPILIGGQPTRIEFRHGEDDGLDQSQESHKDSSRREDRFDRRDNRGHDRRDDRGYDRRDGRRDRDSNRGGSSRGNFSQGQQQAHQYPYPHPYPYPPYGPAPQYPQMPVYGQPPYGYPYMQPPMYGQQPPGQQGQQPAAQSAAAPATTGYSQPQQPSTYGQAPQPPPPPAYGQPPMQYSQPQYGSQQQPQYQQPQYGHMPQNVAQPPQYGASAQHQAPQYPQQQQPQAPPQQVYTQPQQPQPTAETPGQAPTLRKLAELLGA
jgi:RNA recognition motif-containing protein